jgi:hypothetical protein
LLKKAGRRKSFSGAPLYILKGWKAQKQVEAVHGSAVKKGTEGLKQLTVEP